MIIRNLEHYQIETANNQLDRVSGGASLAIGGSNTVALGANNSLAVAVFNGVAVSFPGFNLAGASAGGVAAAN